MHFYLLELLYIFNNYRKNNLQLTNNIIYQLAVDCVFDIYK